MGVSMKKTVAIILGLLSINAMADLVEKNPTILYVGDSHSYGKLGTTIEKNLSTISNHVIMESSCGSTPSTWLGKSGYAQTVCGFWKKDGADETRSVKHNTPKFSEEINSYRPDVVVIQLGTNIAAGEKPANYKASIEEMMNLVSTANSKCIWIGPPDANSKIVTKEKLKVTNDLLIELSKAHNCSYIDSMKITSFPKDSKEGIHYPPSLSAKWGEDVSKQLLEILKNN